MQVDVVIVQTGDDGPAVGVVDLFSGQRDQARRHSDDPLLRTDVHGTPVQQGRSLN